MDIFMWAASPASRQFAASNCGWSLVGTVPHPEIRSRPKSQNVFCWWGQQRRLQQLSATGLTFTTEIKRITEMHLYAWTLPWPILSCQIDAWAYLWAARIPFPNAPYSCFHLAHRKIMSFEWWDMHDCYAPLGFGWKWGVRDSLGVVCLRDCSPSCGTSARKKRAIGHAGRVSALTIWLSLYHVPLYESTSHMTSTDHNNQSILPP